MTVVMVAGTRMQMRMSMVMRSMYGMHMQRVQMRMSMMVLQMRVYMHFLIYLKAYTGYFDADVGVARGRATVYADELLCT
jgi:hypothetical protein